MLLRHALWKQYELIGDGTATAALLFESIFADCVRYVEAGYNVKSLQQHLLDGLDIIQQNLKAGVINLGSDAQIQQVVLTQCHDGELASILGEVFDTLGIYGKVEIQRGYGRRSEREYVHGVLWKGGIQGPELLFDKLNERSGMLDAAIFLSDLDFDDPRDLVPVIDVAHKKAKSLIIVCNELSSRGIGLLTHINATHPHFQVIAVKVSREPAERLAMVEELTLMCGGRPFLQGSGDGIASLDTEDLGQVPEAWANRDYFCIVRDGDDGESRAAFLLKLEERYQRTADADTREAIRKRIGQLMGASAVIRVGGSTESEIESKCELVEGVVKTIRSALESGVVIGGGIALLHCQSALRNSLSCDNNGAKRAAYLSLIKALEQPIRQICLNAGHHAINKLTLIDTERPHCGYDARNDCIVDMYRAGILDPYEVVSSSLANAIRTAALALTIEVIVHRRSPEFSSMP